MDITPILTLATYTTVVCFFFYRLNEKTIREWREEHSKQMAESANNWRDLFKYMNDKIDNKKDKQND
jgi:hypothetical protein